MELTLKLLFLVLLPFLMSGIDPSSGDPAGEPVVGWRPWPKPHTRGPVPTHRPKPTLPPVIPKEKCFLIMGKIPRYYHVFRKFHRPLCVLLNESQLLQMLKDAGGYNPRYVAINSLAACNFTDLSQDVSGPLPTNSSRTVRQKRMVSLPPTTHIRGCRSQVDGSIYKHLCTECAATTRLPANVFPPYINELICSNKDDQCYREGGKCIQKAIKFTFLKRTGLFEKNADLSKHLGMDVYLEKFDHFDQSIKSCCECLAHSFAFCRRRG